MLPPSPERPGTRVTVRNPDSGKWLVARTPASQARPSNPQVTQQVWVCRHLACSGSAMVGVQTEPSPTRHPDRQALERMAKFMPAQAKAQDIMMEAASDGEERMTPLSSKVTEFRGYPAILAESKRTSKGKVNYITRGELFIGVVLVRVVSVAPDRAEATRHFQGFVAALEILDVPPADDMGAPAATTSAALEGNAEPGPGR